QGTPWIDRRARCVLRARDEANLRGVANPFVHERVERLGTAARERRRQRAPTRQEPHEHVRDQRSRPRLERGAQRGDSLYRFLVGRRGEIGRTEPAIEIDADGARQLDQSTVGIDREPRLDPELGRTPVAGAGRALGDGGHVLDAQTGDGSRSVQRGERAGEPPAMIGLLLDEVLLVEHDAERVVRSIRRLGTNAEEGIGEFRFLHRSSPQESRPRRGSKLGSRSITSETPTRVRSRTTGFVVGGGARYVSTPARAETATRKRSVAVTTLTWTCAGASRAITWRKSPRSCSVTS